MYPWCFVTGNIFRSDSILLYDNHSRISKYIGYQIKAEQQTYDEIWRQIVEHKLKNQASVLKILGKNLSAADHILEFAMSVLPGDPHNREAHGAKVYFNTLTDIVLFREEIKIFCSIQASLITDMRS